MGHGQHHYRRRGGMVLQHHDVVLRCAMFTCGFQKVMLVTEGGHCLCVLSSTSSPPPHTGKQDAILIRKKVFVVTQ